MLFRDIYDHLLVTRGKVCRNFFETDRKAFAWGNRLLQTCASCDSKKNKLDWTLGNECRNVYIEAFKTFMFSFGHNKKWVTWKKKMEADPGVLRLVQCPPAVPLPLALTFTKQCVRAEKSERGWSRYSEMMRRSVPILCAEGGQRNWHILGGKDFATIWPHPW